MAPKKGKGGRTPDSEEDALWEQETRSVKKLPRGEKIALAVKSKSSAKPTRRAAPAPEAFPAEPPRRGREMDKRSAAKFEKGDMAIEARIDLHGMRAKQAQDSLSGFIARASAAGLRCVLVITGKGGAAGSEGVLYKSVPQWLEMPPLSSVILRVTRAKQKHGGQGALYVLLRRRK